MYKGPAGSISGRTSRTVAEELNEPQHFEDDPKYDAQHGHPVTKDMPVQEYKEVQLTERAPTGPKDIPPPFTIQGA